MANRLGSTPTNVQTPIRGQTAEEAPDGRWDHDPLCPDESNSPSGLRQLLRTHRRSLLALLAIGVVIIFILAVLPQLAGFGKSLHRLRYGNKLWLAAGVGLECLSLAGYMALFRLLFSSGQVEIGWRSSYQITMAGAVATKLLAAGGAGGIALTVWALRAAGLDAETVARRMTSFVLLHYLVFMLALVIFGAGLAIGLLPGSSPTALTVLPAAFGGGVIMLVAAIGFSADRAERWLSRLARRHRGPRSLFAKLATLPRTLHSGVTTSMSVLAHPKPGLSGTVVYWAFDIATLWAGFRAFGALPPVAVVVLAYYVGQLANVLPIPGGVGGVEGGMIGSFIAFGVNGSTAVLAVLAYRIISFWLPVLPGSIAYLQLRSAVSKWREREPAAAESR
ncbi:MAG: lysylphosphatidylglycerol synthase transmembrane domain-containing protein [Solirubrobacteraceae bacterium]